MREEFEKLVAAGKLEGQHLEPLVSLTTSGYCFHRSWGFGKITTVDTVFARFTIDFDNKSGHQMDLGFAAKSLKPIDPSHILARKAADLESLRQLAAINHLDLIKIVLQSYDGKASIDQIQQVLVPDVIEADWKKWWDTAKKEMKKSGHFLVPTKKSEPIVYQEEEVSLKDRLLADFNGCKGLKAKIGAASEILKNLPDLDAEKAEVVGQVVDTINKDIATHVRTQAAIALEGTFIRDELLSSADVPPSEGQILQTDIWKQQLNLKEVLSALPVAKHRRCLESFKNAFPESWHETVLNTLNFVPTKLCHECISLLIQHGQLDSVKDVLLRMINQHQASTDLLLWLAKERSDQYADILGPEVFRSMLTAIERDQFNEKRSNKLRDFILDDKELLIDLIGSADLEIIKDLTRTLQLSPCFEDMDKRSLLARIVKSYPSVQALISGEQTKQDNSLIVSWNSLERRRKEYTNLVQKKIPENSKEIAIARSYGDLRENHEYKAAKEMQKLLMKRKGELEVDLARARGTDFSNPNTDAISVGTHVGLTDLATTNVENFTILGAWDGDPEKGIISYLTPLAQALLNKKVGDEVELEHEGNMRRLRVDAIAAVPVSSENKEPEEPAQEAAEVPAATGDSSSATPPANQDSTPSPQPNP